MGTRIKSVYVKLDLRTYIIGTWWMGVLSLSSSIIFLMPPTPPYYPIFIFCLGNLILVCNKKLCEMTSENDGVSTLTSCPVYLSNRALIEFVILQLRASIYYHVL